MSDKDQQDYLVTPVARLSFPTLDKPRAQNEGEDPKYSAQLIFDEDADLSALKRAITRLAKDKFGPKVPSSVKIPIRDNEEKAGLDGYQENGVFFNASTKRKPKLRDRARNDADASMFYPGCYVRAVVRPYAYNKKSRGVAIGLEGLQFVRDGEALGGGGVDVDEYFDDIDADDADDDADSLFG